MQQLMLCILTYARRHNGNVQIDAVQVPAVWLGKVCAGKGAETERQLLNGLTVAVPVMTFECWAACYKVITSFALPSFLSTLIETSC